MAKIAQHIFNRKKLDAILDNLPMERLAERAGLSEIHQRIDNWRRLIESKTLEGQNEISLQDSFLRAIFGKILNYRFIDQAPEQWHFSREKKTITDATRSDAALGFFSANQKDVRVIVELKDAKTNLDAKQNRKGAHYTPVEQAFLYSAKFDKNCKWLIVSNYKEIRLYNRNASMNEYEVFHIQRLNVEAELKRFLYLLARKNLIAPHQDSVIDQLYQANEADEVHISKEFYTRYKQLRLHLFKHLKAQNPDWDELILLEKTQKLLDRFIFICYCEDFGLLPERIFRKMMETVDNPLIFVQVTPWDQLKNLFSAIDQGSPPNHINKFNGGLFERDAILDDKLVIGDAIFKELAEITDYDFESELNVNILGHIFEQSISDIEEIKASVAGEAFDKKKGKRKKEGVYYTPEYITRYIVDQAVGGWLAERKRELGADDLVELTAADFDSIKFYKKTGAIKSSNQNIKAHLEFWLAYKEKLSRIKVLDPACGSGAFLNQAFDFLYKEGQHVNEQIARLQKGQIEVFRLDEHILKNNLYGVDLNPESVEITKLSLWLKTADVNSELTALDNNIKCGNSLIDDPVVAGERAFQWEAEFADIMEKGGFDVVIGNPPYIQSRSISDAYKSYYYKNYETSEYQLNTFGLFIEKSIKIIRDNSYYCLIIPNYWLSTRYDDKLRNYVFINHHALKILNVFNVFEDATVDTLIVLGMKTKSLNLPNKTLVKNIDPKLNTINERLEAIRDKNWFFEGEVIFSKNSDTKITFDKKFVVKGRYTLSDFLMFKQGMKPYQVGKGIPPQTKEILKSKPFNSDSKIDDTYFPLLKARSIKRYLVLWENDWIKYGKHLAEPREISLFEGERILVRRIISGDKLEGTYVSEIFINNTDIINIFPKEDGVNSLMLKSLAAIIMSKLCASFLKKQNINLNRRAFPKINVETLKTFPVPKISEGQNINLTQQADIMLSKTQALQELKTSFLTFLESELKPQKITKKLENWNQLDWDQFKKELTKCKLQVKYKDLSLKERKEWQAFFAEETQKAAALQAEIDRTDKAIDQMVYQLYELTDQEIQIVEAGG